MFDAQVVPKVLQMFASPSAPQQIGEIAKECATTEDVVRAVLIAFAPLGLLKEENGKLSLKADKPEVSRLALRSLSRAIENNMSLVGDWNALAAVPDQADQAFDKGSYFLWIIEGRRTQRGDPTPINEESVSRIVFKALGKDGLPYVLMHFGKNSQSFQLIGGKIERGETAVEALLREMREEMRKADLKLNKDYRLSKPREISFCYRSTRTGAYTKFNILHFIARDMQAPPKLSETLRWIGLDEISQGRTKTGERIVPPPTGVQPLLKLLKGASRSFTATIDPNVETEPRESDLNLKLVEELVAQLKAKSSELTSAGADKTLDARLATVEAAVQKGPSHSSALRGLLADVRNAVSGAAGNLIASGAILMINRLLGIELK